MSITEKGIITLHIEPDDEAQNDYNDCPKIDLPITVTELKNLSESKRVFQDKWHVEYVSSKYHG